MRSFLLLMAAIGTVVPWLFFGRFVAASGLDPIAFLTQPFVNGAAGGFAADAMIAAATFLVWSFADARERAVRHWWVAIPATLLVGLSLSLPLYLLMREGRGVALARA
ncbi:MAG: hypothetical protein BroJett030_16030 [Alphaproteobacteria bacterium]|nr:MAG: hypothetical protein BroJett030_16030 [Alphaproteobacteria bacterium]